MEAALARAGLKREPPSRARLATRFLHNKADDATPHPQKRPNWGHLSQRRRRIRYNIICLIRGIEREPIQPQSSSHPVARKRLSELASEKLCQGQ
jgi:hypothetical protein